MKGKKKIASILACAMLLSAAPVEAMAYTVPDTVRVGLESVCKKRGIRKHRCVGIADWHAEG